MRRNLSILVLVCLFICCNAVEEKSHTKPKQNSCLDVYNFNQPDAVFELPKALSEISGISFLNDTVIAAISDDKPYVYIYNLIEQHIVKKIKITSGKDFEDVTICGDTAFVLQSDGVIWQVVNFNNSVPIISSIKLAIEQPFELEGLCHNITNDTLFIAAKYWHCKREKQSNYLPVWAYDISKKKSLETPVLVVPAKIKSQKKGDAFHTSAFTPFCNNQSWLFISTNIKYLLQLNSNGVTQQIIPLQPSFFIQPEGIAINSLGNIYVSNEGKSGNATMLQFNKKNTMQ